MVQGMNPFLTLEGLEYFEVIYFPGADLFWKKKKFFLGGLSFRGGLYLLGGTWYFLAHKLYHKQFNFLFPCIYNS